MKTHWQRTHAVEWDIASLSASSGSRSLLSTFRTPRLFCGSKAKNPRDHSVKCASMFQLLAMRTLRENGITTPLPSRGPALKQSQTEPKYQRFDIAKTSLGRFFKPSAGHESDAGSSLGRTAVVVATTSKSDHVTEFLPPAPAALPTHWLGCLVLGNPHNHCYMNSSLLALLHATQISGCSTKALLMLRGLCQGYAQRGSTLYLASQLQIRAVLREWTIDRKQHDAVEFTVALLHGLGLKLSSWEARSGSAAGAKVLLSGHSFVSLPLRPKACSLQSLIEDWVDHQHVHALTHSGGPVLLHVVRNADTSKNHTLVSIAPILRVPVFTEDVHIAWHLYKVCSIVEHVGDCTTSGHYRAVLKAPNGWLLTDDHCVARSVPWSVLREELLYLVWLVPAQSEEGLNSRTDTALA